MIRWTPKILDPLNLDKAQSQQYYQRRILCLVGIVVLGCIITFLLSSNSFPAITTISITAAFFLFFYIRWRSFFLSYWHMYSSQNFYYEDYAWKDSLIIALILIGGIGLSGFVIFYIAARVDFTQIQPIALFIKSLL